MTNPTTGKAASVKLDYCMTKATAVSRQKKIDESLRPFFESVNSTMSDYAVVEKIYENIIGLVDYDSLGLDESKSAPKGNKPDDLRSIYGVFVKKKAVCAGYVVATQYLLNRMGIECTYIRGETTQGYHAWNLLKLEGDYYYMDTTWGDSSNTDKTKSSDRMDYDYFCLTTDDLLKDHTPDADYPVPMCTATKCNYHHRNNLFFTEYSFSEIQSAVCRIVGKGKRYISCRFATNQAYCDAKKKLIEEGDFRKAIRFAKNKTGKRIGPDYRYSAVENKLKIDFFLD